MIFAIASERRLGDDATGMAEGMNHPTADEYASLVGKMERESAKLRVMQEIAELLGSTLDMDELLMIMVGKVSAIMEADRTTIYLLDEERRELWARAAEGADVREIRLPLGRGLAGEAAASGKIINIADAYQDPRFDAEWDRRTGYRTRSIICMPIMNHHRRTLGVIECLNKVSGVFTKEDESLLASVATQAAVAIENSQLFLGMVEKNIELMDAQEQLQRKIRELDVLFEIAHVAATAVEQDELLHGVLARAMRAVEAEAASILLADEVTGDLHFRAAVGGEPEAIKHLKIGINQGICGWVARHGKPQIVNNVDEDPRHSHHISEQVGYFPRSVLAVPLRWDDGIGALELLNKREGMASFTDEDLRFATLIAGHISTAIAQAHHRERRAKQERLSTVGQFLSGVLHDIKTPMTIISGTVELMAEEEDHDKRVELKERIKKQLERLAAMTGETLAFARGDRKLWIRKVYLAKFFDDLVETLREDLAQKNIALELDLRDRGIAFFDEYKLQRVLHNLVRNAAEALSDGGGRCRIIVDRSESGELIIEVEDDGPGIPSTIRDRIFESFASHGKTHGIGLGLAVVKSLVEDHGGRVDVESEPGRTVFRVEIPPREEPAYSNDSPNVSSRVS